MNDLFLIFMYLFDTLILFLSALSSRIHKNLRHGTDKSNFAYKRYFFLFFQFTSKLIMTKFDIIIFATITISVAFASTIPENVNRDNCQYAPGNWIGNGNFLTPCHCQTYGVHWYVEDFSGDATTLAITRYV